MEKSFAYILNCILFITFYSCQETKKQDFENLTAEERVLRTKELEYQRGFHYQASSFRQAYTDSLIALNPENASYYQGKSIGHSKIGDYHISFPLLEKAMKLDPKETLYYTSWLMTDLYKDYDRAIEYLNRYDDYTPGQVDYAWGNNVNFLKGEVLQALGRHEEAIAEFTKAINEEGMEYIDPSAFPYRGISYMALKKYKKAIADFDLGIKVYDKSSLSYYYKGIALLEMGKKNEALIHIEKAKELVSKGFKKSDPYKEVYNEIYLMQIEDKLREIGE
ncbi:tetratricopeptide repeat protein [Aquimarina sp. SS2-1]|uniref:tetratricopeptide repeat protein n=1 Tax=Aquimarina besae TaxID=3342247 RepID=UPI00366D8878